jgi:broad specificity phosphatase PhoE
MESHIHLIRHGESEHNITKDRTHRDPPLSPLGLDQAKEFVQAIPNQDRIGLVVASPLRRSVQTAVTGFSQVIDKAYLTTGIDNGAKLIFDPDLQGRGDEPCETGSDRVVLESLFPGLNFGSLKDGWTEPGDEEFVKARSQRVLQRLAKISEEMKDQERRDIAVVTHGIMTRLMSHGDKPGHRSGWGGFKSYRMHQADDGTIVLIELDPLKGEAA